MEQIDISWAPYVVRSMFSRESKWNLPHSRYLVSISNVLICVAALVAMLPDSAEGKSVNESARTTAIASPMTYLYVKIVEDIVTVHARNVNLKDLLGEIARQREFEINLHGLQKEHLSVKINRLPLPEAMNRILRHYNFALYLTDPKMCVLNTCKVKPDKLWVFASKSVDGNVNTNDTGDFSYQDSSLIITQQTDQLIGYSKRIAKENEDLKLLDEFNTVTSVGLAINDENPRIRADAISALADEGSEGAFDTITAALDDSDSGVREEAVYALGNIGGERAILALEQVFKDDNINVREAAFEVFTEIGGDDSARALGGVMRDDDATLRRRAVDALGGIGGDTAILLLQDALTDSDNNVRETAKEMLAELLSWD